MPIYYCSFATPITTLPFLWPGKGEQALLGVTVEASDKQVSARLTADVLDGTSSGATDGES